MQCKLEDYIRISPREWPGKELRVQPGDLNQFAPGGLGISGPFPMRPWDNPLTFNPAQYYGFEPHVMHPIGGAPSSYAAGGTVYFDEDHSAEDLAVLFRILEIRGDQRGYAAFLQESSDSVEERYLVQLRIVSTHALASMFGALSAAEAEAFEDQPLSIGEALTKFVEDQRQVWGRGMSSELSGTFGGDGDWAKESLAFGLFIENGYQGVYRIWSRAWLVTK